MVDSAVKISDEVHWTTRNSNGYNEKGINENKADFF